MQFKREKYLKQLIERMHNGEIKVITGIRRCGKSYLLEDVQRCHAGDLRHQIWSDGKIKVFHPWKIKNRKIGL